MAHLSLLFVTVAALCFSAVQANPIEARDKEVIHVTNVEFGHDNAVQKRDVTSAWSYYIDTTNGSSATGACKGVYYNDHSHGACVSSEDKCGKKIYAYIGDGKNPKYQTNATVVDVCSGIGENGVYFTLDSFKELGGTVDKGVIYNVNWKYKA